MSHLSALKRPSLVFGYWRAWLLLRSSVEIAWGHRKLLHENLRLPILRLSQVVCRLLVILIIFCWCLAILVNLRWLKVAYCTLLILMLGTQLEGLGIVASYHVGLLYCWSTVAAVARDSTSEGASFFWILILFVIVLNIIIWWKERISNFGIVFDCRLLFWCLSFIVIMRVVKSSSVSSNRIPCDFLSDA